MALVLLGVGVAAAGTGSMGKVLLSITVYLNKQQRQEWVTSLTQRGSENHMQSWPLKYCNCGVHSVTRKGHHSILFLLGILKNCFPFLCIIITVIDKCKLHKLMGFFVTWLCTHAMCTDHVILTLSPYH